MDRKYQKYFHEILCKDGETLKQYRKMFDTKRTPEEKRKEFNKKYDELFERLRKEAGLKSKEKCKCMLQYAEDCDIKSGVEIDHIIPLKSNQLNKEIKHTKTQKGRKVESESFGSNDISNLIICCKNCNSKKKHIILERNEMQKILERKAKQKKR